MSNFDISDIDVIEEHPSNKLFISVILDISKDWKYPDEVDEDDMNNWENIKLEKNRANIWFTELPIIFWKGHKRRYNPK